MIKKNHKTSLYTKITQPLHTQQQKMTHPVHQKNIARIAKSCPENITLVVKSVKCLCPKVFKKYIMFLTVVTAVTVWSVVRKNAQPFNQKNQGTSFRKSNLTHLTTDVMFLGQCFAILAIFSRQLWKTGQTGLTGQEKETRGCPISLLAGFV